MTDVSMEFHLERLMWVHDRMHLILLRVPGVNFDPRGAKRVTIF